MSLGRTVYQVQTVSGAPVWTRRNYTAKELRQACQRADEGALVVVDLTATTIGDQIVYASPKYRKRYPFGNGGGPQGDPVVPDWTQRGAQLDAAEAEWASE